MPPPLQAIVGPSISVVLFPVNWWRDKRQKKICIDMSFEGRERERGVSWRFRSPTVGGLLTVASSTTGHEGPDQAWCDTQETDRPNMSLNYIRNFYEGCVSSTKCPALNNYPMDLFLIRLFVSAWRIGEAKGSSALWQCGFLSGWSGAEQVLF